LFKAFIAIIPTPGLRGLEPSYVLFYLELTHNLSMHTLLNHCRGALGQQTLHIF